MAACAASPGFTAAEKPGAYGYLVQPIERGRYRVSYTDSSVESARDYALLRAAQVTLENGKDWFQIVNAYSEAADTGGSRSSISIGGRSGSYGRSSGIGVGLGVGIPIGGGGGKVTHAMEIITGQGAKPADANAYDARDVQSSIGGIPR